VHQPHTFNECVCVFIFTSAKPSLNTAVGKFVYLSWMEVLWTVSVAQVAAGDFLVAFADVT